MTFTAGFPGSTVKVQNVSTVLGNRWVPRWYWKAYVPSRGFAPLLPILPSLISAASPTIGKDISWELGGSVWRESSEERSDSSRPRWVSSTPAGATAWICGEPTRWDAVRSSAVPVLLIHGTEDINILPWHSRVLAQADPAHAQLWLVPGARHCGAVGVRPDEFWSRVLVFFALHNSVGAAST